MLSSTVGATNSIVFVSFVFNTCNDLSAFHNHIIELKDLRQGCRANAFTLVRDTWRCKIPQSSKPACLWDLEETRMDVRGEEKQNNA